jgi:hypothetical protein
MFSEERARWKKFFDVFKKHFGEEVGLVPSVYESDDIDIDFVLGEESGQLYGIKVLQIFPDEEFEDEEESAEEDEDKDEDDDEEGPGGYVIDYTFIKTDTKLEDIKEELRYELDFELESEDDESEKVHLDFYANDEDEFTAVVVKIDNEMFGVYLEHPDFED